MVHADIPCSKKLFKFFSCIFGYRMSEIKASITSLFYKKSRTFACIGKNRRMMLPMRAKFHFIDFFEQKPFRLL